MIVLNDVQKTFPFGESKYCYALEISGTFRKSKCRANARSSSIEDVRALAY